MRKTIIIIELQKLKFPKNTSICFLNSDSSIESLDEKKMNEKGWYRK